MRPRMIAVPALAALLTLSAPAQGQHDHHHHHGIHHHHGGFGPGLGFGFVAGALLGSALAANPPVYDYGPGYDYEGPVYGGPVFSGDPDAYCASRFRSYDPVSGTYLGYDGRRHPCP